MRCYALMPVIVVLLSGCISRSDIAVVKQGTSAPKPIDSLSTLLVYFDAASILGLAASVALIIWGFTPQIKKLGIIGLTFWGLVLGASVSLEVIIPYLPYIVFGGLSVGAAVLIWAIYTHIGALHDLYKNAGTQVSDKTKAILGKLPQ